MPTAGIVILAQKTPVASQAIGLEVWEEKQGVRAAPE